ncbi:hypothetical protein HI914_05951 [Erysiphe necator]|nr:hypothetical protein HI914_05951 [Erysiphe necator]
MSVIEKLPTRDFQFVEPSALSIQNRQGFLISYQLDSGTTNLVFHADGGIFTIGSKQEGYYR